MTQHIRMGLVGLGRIGLEQWECAKRAHGLTISATADPQARPPGVVSRHNSQWERLVANPQLDAVSIWYRFAFLKMASIMVFPNRWANNFRYIFGSVPLRCFEVRRRDDMQNLITSQFFGTLQCLIRQTFFSQRFESPCADHGKAKMRRQRKRLEENWLTVSNFAVSGSKTSYWIMLSEAHCRGRNVWPATPPPALVAAVVGLSINGLWRFTP